MKTGGKDTKKFGGIPKDKISLMKLLAKQDIGPEVRLAAWGQLKKPRLRGELGDSGLVWVATKAIDDDIRREANEFRQSNIVPFSVGARRADKDGFYLAAVL